MTDSIDFPTEFAPDADFEVIMRRAKLPAEPQFDRQFFFGDYHGQLFALVQDQILPLDDDEQQMGYPLVYRIYLMQLGGPRLILELNQPMPNITIRQSRPAGKS